jgi:hypothetical protein
MTDTTNPPDAHDVPDANEAHTAQQIDDVIARMTHFLERLGSWRLLPTSAELHEYHKEYPERAETIARAKAAIAYSLATMSAAVCHRTYVECTGRPAELENEALASHVTYVAAGLLTVATVLDPSHPTPFVEAAVAGYRMKYGQNGTQRDEFLTGIAHALLSYTEQPEPDETPDDEPTSPGGTSTPEIDS